MDYNTPSVSDLAWSEARGAKEANKTLRAQIDEMEKEIARLRERLEKIESFLVLD